MKKISRYVMIAWFLLLGYNGILLTYHLTTGHWWWAAMNGVVVGLCLFGMYFGRKL